MFDALLHIFLNLMDIAFWLNVCVLGAMIVVILMILAVMVLLKNNNIGPDANPGGRK